MADYHPLIARAVTGLEKNTGENRRALYERARTALVAQLRGVVPPLDESEITRERLALEEAIRKVEAESARHARETARPAFIKRATETRREEPRREEPRREEPQREDPRREEQHRDGPSDAATAEASPAPAPQPAAAVARGSTSHGTPRAPRTTAAPSAQAPGSSTVGSTAPSPRSAGGRRSLADEAMKGFRDVVSDPNATAHPERHGYAGAQALPPAPSLPPPPPPPARHPLQEFGQLEPQVQPENLWALPLDGARGAPQPDYGQSDAPSVARSVGEDADEPTERRRPRSYGRAIRAAVFVFLLLAAGVVAYWQRDAIGDAASGIASLFRPSAPPREAAAPSRTKIPDRIGQPTTQPSAGPAVAQRVVLYEEDPDDPQGKRFVGAVIWRTETRPATPGRPPDLAVRADIDVPERKMTVTWSLRRNTDQALPASHTIEIMFNTPADAQSGGVQNVPGVLMKQAEQTRGVPLAGLAVKVTPGFFLIGLSALETDMQRNLQLLKERSWFDIPIVYNNNRRAILAMEKGTPGERAFADAFAAWRQ
jgi:hypothetical protein